jgi:hypothetical protein
MQREKEQEDANEYEGSCLLLHMARICWFTHTIWFTQGNRLIVNDYCDIPDKWKTESSFYIVDRNKIELRLLCLYKDRKGVLYLQAYMQISSQLMTMIKTVIMGHFNH